MIWITFFNLNIIIFYQKVLKLIIKIPVGQHNCARWTLQHSHTHARLFSAWLSTLDWWQQQKPSHNSCCCPPPLTLKSCLSITHYHFLFFYRTGSWNNQRIYSPPLPLLKNKLLYFKLLFLCKHYSLPLFFIKFPIPHVTIFISLFVISLSLSLFFVQFSNPISPSPLSFYI